MKLKYCILLFYLFLTNHSFSQRKPVVLIKIISKIQDTVYEQAIQKIILSVQNFSAKTVYVSNVPILTLNYDISKKNGNDYISIDSSCIFLPQPYFPHGGIRLVPLKNKKKLDIPFGFPPPCNFGENGNGDYKIKFRFGYFIGNRGYSIETAWYKYTCKFY